MSVTDRFNQLNAENKELREEIRHLHEIMKVQGRVSMSLMKTLLDEVDKRRKHCRALGDQRNRRSEK